MELSEKLKFFRSLKGWSQEAMAEKLDISVYAYAKIERGETDVNFSRLQQISEVLEIELPNLLGLDEKNVFHLTGQNQRCDNWHWQVDSLSMGQLESQHELEKAQLIIKQQQKEIDYLKEINHFLKNKPN